MQLGRYQVSTLRPDPILSVTFSNDGRYFAVAGRSGYEVWMTYPLGLIRRRTLPGTLALALMLPYSPLLVLQGGGSDPLFPPNKAVIYHDGRGTPVAEVEFGERIRGISARNGMIVIALLRKSIAFEYGVHQQGGEVADLSKLSSGGDSMHGAFWLRKLGEWETAENDKGLVALSTAPGTTLLALPGRQPGHVQLIQLPPCPAPSTVPSRPSSTHTFRSPIVLAHTHPLTSLACSATGSHFVTASERGTLLRVWDAARGSLERELRRGVDRAEMWGVDFEDRVFQVKEGELGTIAGSGAADGTDDERRRDELRRKGGRVAGWSDKGTIHIWANEDQAVQSGSPNAPSFTNMLSKTLSLPKYFSSTASFAQYHLPRKNPHAFSSAIGAASAAAGVPSMRIDDGTEPQEREWAEHFVVGWVEVEVEDERSLVSSPPLDDHSANNPTIKLSAKRPSLAMGSREERRSFGSDTTSTRTATPSLGARRTETPTMPGSGLGSPAMGSVPTGLFTSPVGNGGFSAVPHNLQNQHHARRSSSGSLRTSSSSPAANSSATRVSSTTNSGSGGSHLRKDSNRLDNNPSGTGTGTGRRISSGNKTTAAVSKNVVTERQLIAITYSGDWYRLRIPRSAGDMPSGSGGGGGIEEGDDVEEKKNKKKCELVEYRRFAVGGGGW